MTNAYLEAGAIIVEGAEEQSRDWITRTVPALNHREGRLKVLGVTGV